MDDVRAYQSVLPENWRHKKNSILDDLEHVLNYIDAPVLVLSDTGVILYTNSALLDLTSHNLDELIGGRVETHPAGIPLSGGGFRRSSRPR